MGFWRIGQGTVEKSPTNSYQNAFEILRIETFSVAFSGNVNRGEMLEVGLLN